MKNFCSTAQLGRHRVLAFWCFMAFSRAAASDGSAIQVGRAKVVRAEVSAAFHEPVLSLNQYTFHGNVLKPVGENFAAHWVVMYCPPWWEMCQRMVLPYSQAGAEWQGKLNNGLMTLDVRFAKVDCATDKVLCNEQEVEGYPTVQHFIGGQRVATWNGGRQNDPERLTKWLTSQLGAIAVEKEKNVPQTIVPTLSGVVDSAKTTLKQMSPGDYSLDALLFVGILALVARAVCENPKVWQTHGLHPSSQSAKPSRAFESSSGSVALEARAGVVRFLPSDWAGSRTSIEL